MRHKNTSAGFSLFELVTAMAIFLVIGGTMFSLLGRSQQQFRNESEIVDSFQEARLGLDQIIRDADDSGYPPLNHFSITPAVTLYAQSPVAWTPSYPATACVIGTTCTTPGNFDVIFEEDINNTGVQWIRYQLVGTTLFRGATPKVAGADPAATTSAAGIMVPYILNVMNNTTAAQIALIRATYPAMFPGGLTVPIFTYTTAAAVAGAGCQAAANSPCNILDIQVTLIVQTPQLDSQTRALRLVELSGRSHRLNPNK